jgi:lipoate synthase
MSRPIKLVLDCHDPVALAEFWAPALDYVVVGSVENYTLLTAEDTGAQLLLQKVNDPKVGKNRMHLDITCADVTGEVSRLERLGARRAGDDVDEHGTHWVVTHDPEGNEFCVCDGGQG